MPSSDGALGTNGGCTVVAFPARHAALRRVALERLGEARSFVGALLVVPLVVALASVVALALLLLFWAVVPFALGAVAWVLARRPRRARALPRLRAAPPA